MSENGDTRIAEGSRNDDEIYSIGRCGLSGAIVTIIPRILRIRGSRISTTKGKEEFFQKIMALVKRQRSRKGDTQIRAEASYRARVTQLATSA